MRLFKEVIKWLKILTYQWLIILVKLIIKTLSDWLAKQKIKKATKKRGGK